jgi:hypothetical protein
MIAGFRSIAGRFIRRHGLLPGAMPEAAELCDAERLRLGVTA